MSNVVSYAEKFTHTLFTYYFTGNDRLTLTFDHFFYHLKINL